MAVNKIHSGLARATPATYDGPPTDLDKAFGFDGKGGISPTPAFRDVITGGIYDILQETKPVGYDERAEAFNRIKNDAYGIRSDLSSNASMIEKTDAAMQRISKIADGIRAMETTTLEQKLGDLSYGIFHDFYERVQKKYGKKLESK